MQLFTELGKPESVCTMAPNEHIEPVPDDRGVWRIGGMILAEEN
jgi:hypothetical protein